MSVTVRKDWPPTARDVLLEAARFYYNEMTGSFPVGDVAMDRAIEWANAELVAGQQEIEDEASDAWINRWDKGPLDEEMRKAITTTFRKLRSAEGPLRAHATKKNARQLDAEISEALGRRGGAS